MKALAFLIGTIFILTFALGAFAQVDNEVVAPDSRVWGWFKKGGPLMYPIAFCSLLSLAIILERIIGPRSSHAANHRDNQG